MTTTLSAWSRITSSSYSFHPATDCSMRISDTGLVASPCAATARSSSASSAKPVPPPPRMNDGRHDQRVADLLGDLHGFVERVREPRRGHARPISSIAALNSLAVLGGADGLDAGADELDAVLVEHARLVELDREVERGLAAEGREQRVGPLPLDDAGEALRRRAARRRWRRRTRGRS